MSSVLNKNVNDFSLHNSKRYVNEIYNVFKSAYDNSLVYLTFYHGFIKK